jgi:hypothetical protein
MAPIPYITTNLVALVKADAAKWIKIGCEWVGKGLERRVMPMESVRIGTTRSTSALRPPPFQEVDDVLRPDSCRGFEFPFFLAYNEFAVRIKNS